MGWIANALLPTTARYGSRETRKLLFYCYRTAIKQARLVRQENRKQTDQTVNGGSLQESRAEGGLAQIP